MKMLLLKTWRDMKARKGQFIGLIILVMLGIAIYSAFVGAASDLQASADRSNEEFHLADFETRVMAAPTEVAGEIADIDGVETVQGRLIVDTGLDMGTDEVAIRVVGIPADASPAVDEVDVVEGSYLDSSRPKRVLAHNGFAEARDVQVGDSLRVRVDGATADVEVGGLAQSAEYFFLRRVKDEMPNAEEFGVLWAPQETVEELFGQPDTYNSFAVLLEDGADRDAVIDEVESVLGEYYVLSSTTIEDQPSNFGIQEEIKQNREMAGLMPFLILAVSAMALAIAMARLVQSQRGEIGLSKALGYTDRQVLMQYLTYSVVVAVVGSVLGIALGQLSAYGISEMYRTLLNLPILESSFHAEVAGGAVLLSVVVCLVAGISPAVRSARMAPAKAMHSDPNLSQTKGRIPIVERLLGWAMPRTIAFRLPLRNVFRSRRRSVYTVLGTIFALVLIVSTWALNDSIGYLMAAQFEEIDLWGAAVTFDENIPVSEARAAADVRGVTDVDTALATPVTLSAGDEERELILSAISPDADFHGFEVEEGAEVEETLRGGGLVLPGNLARTLGVGVGDTVEVASPYIDGTIDIEVETLSKEMWGSPLFVGEEVGRRLVDSDQSLANVAYVDYEGVTDDEIEKALFAQPRVADVRMKNAVVEMLEGSMGLFRAVVGLLFVFAFAVAFVVIYNTFTTNVIERTREIATIQTIGEDRRHMAWMITAENLLLAVVSVPFGVLAGLWAAQQMFDEVSTEAYTLPAYISPDSYWLIAGSVLAILLLSEIPPLRRIFRMDLAEATKVME
ncbi:MAG: FtsX-like permease family protein [Coriobacteriia bacterium]|nr:FtsX-like permease family protein [Coriobacteriia bacterium]